MIARVFAAVLALCAGAQAAAAELTLATWNIAWLRSAPLAPADYAACKAMPREAREQLDDRHPMRWICRGEEHYAALARIAARVNADVFALQEIESVAAIERLFPPDRYRAFLTTGGGLQQVGFAVKRSVPVLAFAEYASIAQPGLDLHRAGADLTIRQPDGRPLRLLNVHLKSACHDRPLTDPTPGPYDRPESPPPCLVLAAQVKPLEAWIDARARERTDFVVLGDFNRRLDAPLERAGPARDGKGRQRTLWKEIDDADPPGLVLARLTEGRRQIRNCQSGDRGIAAETRAMFIDHIVAGPGVAARVVPGSVYQWSLVEGKITRENRDFLRGLSDHCPLSARLGGS